ncbi:Indoleamine 2,3-dioxygenase [Mycena epipterygia]|nr:Indoleamine 2,3-dioxygenase [Mycena epipterygia]
MNVIDLLPSPHHYFSFAVSLLQSTIANNRKTLVEKRRSQVDYDVDPNTGFFPPRPLPHLPAAYAVWEVALAEAGEKLSLGEDDSDAALEKRVTGELWRSQVQSWPVIDTEPLHSNLRLLQRAHLVLAWLVHYYVHSAPAAAEGEPFVVPKSLTLPLVSVSRHLGIAPVLTFADTVLWNWDLVDPSLPVSIDNMHFVNLFSGTEDERNFYTTSARAEFRGIEMLRIIDEYNHLPNLSDLTSISKVARDLTRLKVIVQDLSEIIQSVRPLVDPHVFYWDLRPWFEGSDAKGPSAPGWIYEGVPNSDQLDLSGPSAGQSSVMHALDIFLDVDHKLRQRRYPAPSDGNKRIAGNGFMDRMRRYMPGKHREYLASLAATPRSIRDLAQQTPALREPYDGVVMALKKLRDLHMRIACLYVVTMSRSTPNAYAGCPVASMMERLQSSRAAGNGPARGTGGNELSLLLKAGRDATRRTLLKEN